MKLKIIAKTDTWLKGSPFTQAQQQTRKVFVAKGKYYFVTAWSQSENGHFCIEIDFNAGTWFIFSQHWDYEGDWNLEVENKDFFEHDDIPYQEFITRAQLKVIMPSALSSDLDLYTEPINKVLYEFKINTTLRAAAFLAQIAHESGQLRYKEELASGFAYEGRKDLGNTQKGDGKRYKGRGLIQLTGRANYQQASLDLGLDLIHNPNKIVTDAYLNAKVAGWYWQSRKINLAADRGDFKQVTKLVNGGLNGYEDRCRFYERAKRILTGKPTIAQSWQDIDWHDFSDHVSEFFQVREVVNGQTARIPTTDEVKKNIFRLALELDKVRSAWGSPIIVTSWYRPLHINRQIGSGDGSQHILGKAVDIYPANGKATGFEKWLDQEVWKDRALGYGVKAGRGFTHLDLRTGRIRWNY